MSAIGWGRWTKWYVVYYRGSLVKQTKMSDRDMIIGSVIKMENLLLSGFGCLMYLKWELKFKHGKY